MSNLIDIAEKFKPKGKITNVREYGNGNINKTFIVTLESAGEKHYILQCVNTQVFRQPQLIMQNMRTVTEHLENRLKHAHIREYRRWEVPGVLLTEDGKDHLIDPDGSFWRAISFIDAAQSFDTIHEIEHAEEVGYALGMFHNLLSDLPPAGLADTLEGFHITPRYLLHYEEVLMKCRLSKSPEVNFCIQFIGSRSQWSGVLENASAQGRLNVRTIHGDPKVSNFMIDNITGHAISIVDLDTVKPGLVHYDIGDCLRSGCNPLGEETALWETVGFEMDLCQGILKGYLSNAGEFLSNNDYDYMYDAVRLLPFELGLRFFTDYLEGNVYFKANSPEHNLYRALVQFKLTESIESQERAIRAIIRDVR